MESKNILFDALPHSISVGGAEYPIHTDFRNWIKFELLMTDGGVLTTDKMVPAVRLCYIEGNPLPKNAYDMLAGMLWFFRCGKSVREDKEKEDDATSSKRNTIYSFKHDAELIYSAFYSQYGIDLTRANLHWWTFRALFRGLGEQEKITKIMEYRSADTSKIKDKEQKKFYERMKRIYRLPDERSEEQKEEDFIAAMMGVF